MRIYLVIYIEALEPFLELEFLLALPIYYCFFLLVDCLTYSSIFSSEEVLWSESSLGLRSSKILS